MTVTGPRVSSLCARVAVSTTAVVLAVSGMLGVTATSAASADATDPTVRTSLTTASAPTPVVSGNRLVESRSGLQWVAHAVNWPSFEYACQQGWGGFG